MEIRFLRLLSMGVLAQSGSAWRSSLSGDCHEGEFEKEDKGEFLDSNGVSGMLRQPDSETDL